jgi:hypothetical protein
MKLTPIKFSLISGFKLGGIASAPKKEPMHVRCVSEEIQ